jgi:hypothetical protein
MNKQLGEIIARLNRESDERQQAAAALLLDFLDWDGSFDLTPEQISDIESRLEDDEVATDEEVKVAFERMTK